MAQPTAPIMFPDPKEIKTAGVSGHGDQQEAVSNPQPAVRRARSGASSTASGGP